MRPLGILIVVCISVLITKSAAISDNGDSLARIAEIVADALATEDAGILKRHSMTYEDKVHIAVTKTERKPAFLKARKERKKRIDETWREFREEKLMVERVHIEEVEIQEREGSKQNRYLVVATVIPVFTIKGKTTPVPFLAMRLVQIKGQWKYWY